jgi:ZIP family zinc transporter
MDAVAPVIGAALSLLIVLPPSGLAPILAVFAGFFLYIGASDLLPESHHAHPRLLTTIATLLGAATLLFATRMASGI